MPAEDYSGKIGLDTTDWKTGISQINRDVRSLQSGFRVVAAGLDNWKTSAAGLQARNETLGDIIDKQKTKVSLLTSELESMREEAKSSGDTTQTTANALQDFQIKVNRAAEELAKSETELRKNNEALALMEDSSEDAADETDALGESATTAEKEHKKLGDTLRDVGSYVGKAFVTGIKAAAAAVVAVGAAAGAAAIKLAREVISKFSELEQNLGGSEAVFGQYAENVQALGEQAYKNMGTSQSKYLATANVMGALFQGAGLEQERSMDLTTAAMQRAADMASVMGIDVQVALDSVAGAAKGNFTMMDNLGVAMNATTLEAYALSKGLDFTWSSASNADKAELAMQMFFENTEQYAGNFAREAETTISGSIGMMQAATESFIAGLGNSDADMTTLTKNMVDSFQAVANNVTPVLENIVSSLPTVVATIATELGDMLPTLITSATDIFNQVLDTLVALLPTLIPVASDALTTIATALLENVDPIMTAAMDLITALGTALLDNLPLLVSVASDLLLKFVGYISENAASLVDGATQIMTGIVDGITALLPDLIPLALNLMVQFALALVAAIPDLVAKLPEIVTAIIDGLKAVDWLQLGTDLLTGLYNGLNAALESVIESIKGVFTSIWDAIKGVFGIASPSTVASEAGGFILDGLVAGFLSAVDAVVTKVKEIFGKIWDAIKSIFGFGQGESEESKEAKESGKNIMSGMQKGIDENKETVETAVKDVSKNVLKKFRDELGIPENGGDASETKPFGESAVSGLAQGITDKGVESTFSGAAGSVKGAISKAFSTAFGVAGGGWFQAAAAASEFKSIGEAVAQGIANGINDGASKITAAAKTAAKNALAAAKKELGIESPSKKAYGEIGVPFIQGIASALSDGTRSLQDGVGSAMQGMTSARFEPLKLDAGDTAAIVPVRADLILDGRTFGSLVVDMADRGQGFIAANQQRLQMGVSLG